MSPFSPSFPRQLTIPIPCDGYYSRPIVALSTTLSPIWLLYYFQTQFDIDLLSINQWLQVTIFGIPPLVGLLVARYAPAGEIPMRMIVSVPITLWGFVMSATWLDLIADQLVRLLSFFGIVCRIPPTIIGITILAWGNSLQDMVANLTLARKGLTNMSITACFAGPIFNMLIGLGLGFSALLSIIGESSTLVELTPPLTTGFLFSGVNGVLVIVTGALVGRGRIPRHHGYAALTLYVVYVAVSLTL